LRYINNNSIERHTRSRLSYRRREFEKEILVLKRVDRWRKLACSRAMIAARVRMILFMLKLLGHRPRISPLAVFAS